MERRGRCCGFGEEAEFGGLARRARGARRLAAGRDRAAGGAAALLALATLVVDGVVHALAQLLANLEERQALGRDVDRRARARVAALVALVLADREAAEATDFDTIAALKRRDHRVEDAVDDLLRLPLGKLDLVG